MVFDLSRLWKIQINRLKENGRNVNETRNPGEIFNPITNNAALKEKAKALLKSDFREFNVKILIVGPSTSTSQTARPSLVLRRGEYRDPRMPLATIQ